MLLRMLEWQASLEITPAASVCAVADLAIWDTKANIVMGPSACRLFSF